MSSGWVFAETTDFFAEYDLGDKLGGGAYGKVYKCIHRETGDIRAVKCIQKQHFLNEFDLFRHEVSIMKEVNHPNVIKFYGFYETLKLLYIVMEYCEGGELFRYIRKKFAPRGFWHRNAPCLLRFFGLVKPKVYSERQVADWLRQTLEGLEYLHSKRIVHADIKPQNLMLKYLEDDKSRKGMGDSPIKIIDFGLASVVKKKHLIRGQDGTPEYMSPECIKGKYTIHSDMWSIGVLLFTLLFGFSPFWSQSVYETYRLITKHGFQPEIPTPNYSNSFPAYIQVSDDAKDLIIRLLKQDPVSRLSASEALAHPWFASASKTPINTGNGKSVVQNINQQAQRSKLHKLVLEMLIESITDEDLEAWKSELMMVSRRKGGVVDFQGLKNTLAILREKGTNSGLFSPVALMSPSVVSPRSKMNRHQGYGAGAGAHGPNGLHGLSGLSSPIPGRISAQKFNQNTKSTEEELLDMDRSAVNLRELLIQTVEMKLLAKEERVWSAFDAIDADGDGAIGAEELAKALNIPKAAAERIIRECDEDGDGLLDLDEFVEQFLPTSIEEKEKERLMKQAKERQIARIKRQRAEMEARRKAALQEQKNTPTSKGNTVRGAPITISYPNNDVTKDKTKDQTVKTGKQVQEESTTKTKVNTIEDSNLIPLPAPTINSSNNADFEEESKNTGDFIETGSTKQSDNESETFYSPKPMSTSPKNAPVGGISFAHSEATGLSLELDAKPVKKIVDPNAPPIGLVFPLSQVAENPMDIEERFADLWDMGVFLPVAKQLHNATMKMGNQADVDMTTAKVYVHENIETDEEPETEADDTEADAEKLAKKRGQILPNRSVPASVIEKQHVLRNKISQQSAILSEALKQQNELQRTSFTGFNNDMQN